MILAILVLQDTRPLEEYHVSHLPGAVQVDPNDDSSLKTVSLSPDSRGELDRNITTVSHYNRIMCT